MLGVEEGKVYYEAFSKDFGDDVRQYDKINDLPSISDCGIFFKRFLHTYGSQHAGILIRQLFENIKSGNYTLELNLHSILHSQTATISCKNQGLRDEATSYYASEKNDDDDFHHLCTTTPLCGKAQHRVPSSYITKLGSALKHRPLIYLPLCEKICSNLLVEHNFLDFEHSDMHEDGPEIQILLLSDTQPTVIRSLLASRQEKFVVVPGIVVQASKPQHKMIKMCLQCRFCDHKYKADMPVWKEKPFIPRFCLYAQSCRNSNNLLIESDLGCLKAKDPYVILPNECKYIDTQFLKVQELPENVPTGDIPRHIHATLTRNLCEKLSPGDRVYLHGVLTSYSSSTRVDSKSKDPTHISYVHVLGYRKYDDSNGGKDTFTVEETNLFNKIANSQNVHDKIFRSVAPSLYGLDDVKKAAACLLFGGTKKLVGDESKLRGDINVLLLGDPSVAKSQILKFVNRSAPISVYTSGKGSSAAGLTAAVVRDKRGVFALEGGAMVLADGGVVCIDEFDKMREDDMVAIHEAMEQQTISISKAGITTMLNSRCAVMAAANPSFGSYDDSVSTAEQHDFKATILSRFDLIFIIRDKDNKEKDSILVKHILSLHANQRKAEEDELSIHTLRRYIQYARQNIYPMLSSAAADFLRTYYVKTRQAARSDNRSVTRKIPITIRQLESLIRIAESFAKMAFSSSAEEKHVFMAIDLFNVSTVETSKHTLVFETMTPSEQHAVRQAESAILGRIQKGSRATFQNLMRDLQIRGFDRNALTKALAILIKRGDLQERGDHSIRRP